MDAEEEKDVYHENSYQPFKVSSKPKYNINYQGLLEPILPSLCFSHEGHTSSLIHYYSTHDPAVCKPVSFLCIHGAGHSALVFGQMAKHIREDATLICYDLMCHGESKSPLMESEMSMVNLMDEAVTFWTEISQNFKNTQKWILVGHSLGGCIVTNLAARFPNSFAGVVLVDTIEGAAITCQQDMKKFLLERPQSFTSLYSAIKWNYKAGCVKRMEAARVSVPSFVAEGKTEEHKGKYFWKVNLLQTMSHWEDWFKGVSKKFAQLPLQSKVLLTTSKFRLDRDLTKGLQNQKFQIVLFDHSGHNIQEDQYEKVCRVLEQYYL